MNVNDNAVIRETPNRQQADIVTTGKHVSPQLFYNF
jgi:hypothetical protein